MQSFDWRGKRVFVTGHTGFKGGWLCLWLQELGAEVHGFALPPATEPNLYELARVGERMRSTFGDIRDLPALTGAVEAARPEIVLHLAAQSIVQAGYDDPIGTFATNVLGTAHLLEAARRSTTARAVVVVTSDKCYENREWHWAYRENEPLGGRDPYSASKGCAEIVTHSYRRSFFDPGAVGRASALVASARAGNVLGGGDWAPNRLLTDLVAALRDGRQLVLRHPQAIRPWQHVLEPLRGYLQVAERLHRGDERAATAWNFGPTEADCRSVGWLAARLMRGWGREVPWTVDEVARPHEATYLKLDCNQARAILGWEPLLHLGDGLDWIVDWYRDLDRGADMREVTLGQISRYRALTGERTEPGSNAAVGAARGGQ